MKICWIKWKDALAVEADTLPPRAALAELHSVGFLLDETPEAVLIGMEFEGPTVGRWRLNIPRNQIIEMRVKEIEKAFSLPRRRKSVIIEDPQIV